MTDQTSGAWTLNKLKRLWDVDNIRTNSRTLTISERKKLVYYPDESSNWIIWKNKRGKPQKSKTNFEKQRNWLYSKYRGLPNFLCNRKTRRPMHLHEKFTHKMRLRSVFSACINGEQHRLIYFLQPMKRIMKTLGDITLNTFMPAMFWKTMCTTGKETIWSTRNFQKSLQNLLSAMIVSG